MEIELDLDEGHWGSWMDIDIPRGDFVSGNNRVRRACSASYAAPILFPYAGAVTDIFDLEGRIRGTCGPSCHDEREARSGVPNKLPAGRQRSGPPFSKAK